MASSSDIRPRLVHSAMDQKPRRISRQAHIAADRLAVVVHQNHVAGFQQAKVLRQRVRPEGVRVLRVADGDVAGHAFGIAFAGEDAEGEGHFGEHPLAMSGVRGEGRDAGKRLALRDELEGGFGLAVFAIFHLLFGSGCRLLGARIGDCGGRHDDDCDDDYLFCPDDVFL